jgi:hypothetical protein
MLNVAATFIGSTIVMGAIIAFQYLPQISLYGRFLGGRIERQLDDIQPSASD